MSIDNPTFISQLPIAINTSGYYVLNDNLTCALNTTFIAVNVQNVTIDFQGFYISGTYEQPGASSYGIATTNQSGVTIKNGTIANVTYGISIDGSSNPPNDSLSMQIDNMRMTRCTLIGIKIADSPASRITNCQVCDMGPVPQAGWIGILATNTAGTLIADNIVHSNQTTATGTGIQADSSTSFVRDNAVYGCTLGINGGLCLNNLVLGCTTAFQGGLYATDNYPTPP